MQDDKAMEGAHFDGPSGPSRGEIEERKRSEERQMLLFKSCRYLIHLRVMDQAPAELQKWWMDNMGSYLAMMQERIWNKLDADERDAFVQIVHDAE